jgi:hypothetical protein
MTRQFRCWPQGWARPKRGGCGRTCATIVPQVTVRQSHLSNFTGTLQADGYAGFDQIYAAEHIQEAACWAHVRRKFYDLEVAHKSPVASEALERIAALYAIEKEIRGRPPDERREVRNTRSRPLLESLKQWFEETLGKLSRTSDTAMAVRYALGRWVALLRFCDDGRIEIDNNAAERALRVVALGRKNFLFAGSEWWRKCRGDLQSAGHRQAERNRSRKLSTERVVPYCGSPDQTHRGVVTLERRRKSTAPQPRGGLNEDAATNAPTGGLPDLPYIEETIEQGGISIEVIPPLTECVAVAHEGRNTLAMLKRRKGESLAQLLSRLDLAIARAHSGDIFTDEINPPAKSQRP